MMVTGVEEQAVAGVCFAILVVKPELVQKKNTRKIRNDWNWKIVGNSGMKKKRF